MDKCSIEKKKQNIIELQLPHHLCQSHTLTNAHIIRQQNKNICMQPFKVNCIAFDANTHTHTYTYIYISTQIHKQSNIQSQRANHRNGREKIYCFF